MRNVRTAFFSIEIRCASFKGPRFFFEFREREASDVIDIFARCAFSFHSFSDRRPFSGVRAVPLPASRPREPP